MVGITCGWGACLQNQQQKATCLVPGEMQGAALHEARCSQFRRHLAKWSLSWRHRGDCARPGHDRCPKKENTTKSKRPMRIICNYLRVLYQAYEPVHVVRLRSALQAPLEGKWSEQPTSVKRLRLQTPSNTTTRPPCTGRTVRSRLFTSSSLPRPHSGTPATTSHQSNAFAAYDRVRSRKPPERIDPTNEHYEICPGRKMSLRQHAPTLAPNNTVRAPTRRTRKHLDQIKQTMRNLVRYIDVASGRARSGVCNNPWARRPYSESSPAPADHTHACARTYTHTHTDTLFCFCLQLLRPSRLLARNRPGQHR